VDTVDVTMPSILDVRRGFQALYNLFNVMVEQACSSEGRIVDRARAWCSNLHVPFFRFNPQLSQDIALDEHDDECLVRMMWETRAYMKAQAKTLAQLKPLLVDFEPVLSTSGSLKTSPSGTPNKSSKTLSVSSSPDMTDGHHSGISMETSPEDENSSFHSPIPDVGAPSSEENTNLDEHDSPRLEVGFSELTAESDPTSNVSVPRGSTADARQSSVDVEDSGTLQAVSVTSSQTC
ncbi:85/88 kDa calcium-independent phospholipase A2, partial [Halocaridina rubra]